MNDTAMLIALVSARRQDIAAFERLHHGIDDEAQTAKANATVVVQRRKSHMNAKLARAGA